MHKQVVMTFIFKMLKLLTNINLITKGLQIDVIM